MAAAVRAGTSVSAVVLAALAATRHPVPRPAEHAVPEFTITDLAEGASRDSMAGDTWAGWMGAPDGVWC